MSVPTLRDLLFGREPQRYGHGIQGTVPNQYGDWIKYEDFSRVRDAVLALIEKPPDPPRENILTEWNAAIARWEKEGGERPNDPQ